MDRGDVMNVQELTDQCRATIDSGGEYVCLVRNDSKLLLCGTHGPRGELVCVNAAGLAVVRYSAKAVLRFIQRQERKQAEMN